MAHQLLEAFADLDPNKKESYESKLFGTVYWVPPTVEQASKYQADLFGGGNMLRGARRCVFLRALDEKGNRILRSQEHWKAMHRADAAMNAEVMMLAARMEGGSGDEFFDEDEADSEAKKAGKD